MMTDHDRLLAARSMAAAWMRCDEPTIDDLRYALARVVALCDGDPPPQRVEAVAEVVWIAPWAREAG